MIHVSLTSKVATLDTLHKAANNNKVLISIPRQALVDLLLDHAKMASALRGSSTFKVVEPREREKL